jgi:hypothetical protein
VFDLAVTSKILSGNAFPHSPRFGDLLRERNFLVKALLKDGLWGVQMQLVEYSLAFIRSDFERLLERVSALCVESSDKSIGSGAGTEVQQLSRPVQIPPEIHAEFLLMRQIFEFCRQICRLSAVLRSQAHSPVNVMIGSELNDNSLLDAGMGDNANHEYEEGEDNESDESDNSDDSSIYKPSGSSSRRSCRKRSLGARINVTRSARKQANYAPVRNRPNFPKSVALLLKRWFSSALLKPPCIKVIKFATPCDNEDETGRSVQTFFP